MVTVKWSKEETAALMYSASRNADTEKTDLKPKVKAEDGTKLLRLFFLLIDVVGDNLSTEPH